VNSRQDPNPTPTRALPLPPVRIVDAGAPLRWIARGWSDFLRTPGASLLHGLFAALGGVVVLAVARQHFYLVSGAFSGFVLVAPVLVTGLYELSRRLALGERPGLADAVGAWRRSGRALLGFGLLLSVAGTFWVLVSSVLIALLVQTPITGFEDFLRYVVLSKDSDLFIVWMAMGGVVAALVFAASAVSIPFLLDREVDLLTAILTSVLAVGANPLVMAWWAVLIMVGTTIGIATLLAGLVVVVPVLGHATWHAYLDLVDASELPPRR
jgi:uncharacterized membrane protein